MSEFTSGNQPGLRPRRTSDESQVWWVGRGGQSLIATKNGAIAAAATDDGNAPTTVLRGGLVMAINASSHKFVPYDPDAVDGSQIAVGVLERGQDMLVDGVATDRFTQILVHGLLKEGELVGLDPRAKQQLASRFVFDRDLGCSSVGLLQPCGVVRKSSNYVVTEADQGLLFVATAAVTFTLPVKKNGLVFRFVQSVDAVLAISGSADIIHKGNVAAGTVTFSTSGEKAGSGVLVECVYTATNTLKWIVTNLGGTTATVS